MLYVLHRIAIAIALDLKKFARWREGKGREGGRKGRNAAMAHEHT